MPTYAVLILREALSALPSSNETLATLLSWHLVLALIWDECFEEVLAYPLFPLFLTCSSHAFSGN